MGAAMLAFGGALRCLGNLSTSSMSYSDASLETAQTSGDSWSGSSVVTSSSDLSSVEAAAESVSAPGDVDCYTVDVTEDSPSHPFLEGWNGADHQLIDSVGLAIDNIIASNHSCSLNVSEDYTSSAMQAASRLTSFHGLRPPPISVTAYLRRILQYSKASPVCFVMALSYLERLGQDDPALQLSSLNVHRLAITGVLLAAKLMDDNYYNNTYYAKIGGIGVAELNRLELEMLQLLDYRLRVSPPALESLVQQLIAGVGSAGSPASADDDSGSVVGGAPAVSPATGADADQAEVLVNPGPAERTRAPTGASAGHGQAPAGAAAAAAAGVLAQQRVAPPCSQQAAHAVSSPALKSGSASQAAGSGSEGATLSSAAVAAAPELLQGKDLVDGLVGEVGAVTIGEPKAAAIDRPDPENKGASIATATHQLAATVAPPLPEAIQVC